MGGVAGSGRPRLDALAAVILLIIVVLAGRMVWLQAVQGRHFAGLAEGNRLRTVPVVAPRGVVYDRNGAVLIGNRLSYCLVLNPMGAAVPGQLVDRLASLLAVSPAEIEKHIARQTGIFEPIVVKTDVTNEIVAKIEENRQLYPMTEIQLLPVRDYVNKTMLAHALGYVGEVSEEDIKAGGGQLKGGDTIGKSGLEYSYDRWLRGVDGGARIEVDADGRPVAVLGQKPVQPGNNLVTSIDIRVQRAAEAAFDEIFRQSGATAGGAVAIDVNNGEVLAIVSRPGFDPNWFNGGISEKNWQKINNNPDNPLQERPIAGEYPPGSTFKIVTGTAALQEGVVTPDEQIFDSGRHWLIDKGNAEGEAWGWISFREALARSDNVYFYEMGNRLGIDRLEKYAREFGLGEKTGIDLPGESEGLVASRRYKQLNYNEEWYLSETFDAAIGQGFNLATPLQVAVLMAEVANGGSRWRPHLMRRVVSADGKIVATYENTVYGRFGFRPEVLQLVREGLKDVAVSGTAAEAFRDFPVPVAGKTGTAENPHGRDHGWFVAYAPYDRPRLAVAVIVERAGFGAMTAAPIARRIFEAYFNLDSNNAAAADRVTAPYSCF
ncbi:MAG: penicillin-binding protein 2 [Negativicutes bacterium]|nr:penicillin-binding protein 2 [Negativicutes bacterium]